MDYTLVKQRAARRSSSLLNLLGPLAGRVRSLQYCFAGVGLLCRQPASMFHLIMSALVLAVSAALHVSPGNWRWVVLALVLVWAAEAVNTAIEYACDAASTGYNVAVKKAKDIAAGAVMLSWVGAAVLCGLTWQPYLAHLRMFGG